MPRAPDTPLVAKVLLAAPLPEAFDYLVPVGLDLAVGDLVAAPLGPRTAMGVLVEIRPNPGLNRALKLVAHKLDAPPLPAATLAFLDWAARYSVDAPGVPLAIALRGLRAPRPRPPPPLLVAAPGRPPSLTALRSRVLDAALGPVSRAELVRITGVSSGLVKSLIDRGALVAASAPVAATGDLSLAPRALNPSQAEAARQVGELVAAGRFAATLLDGVTGSGKTEVYLEAAASALARDPEAQVLVLLPEIALTEAVIDRFGQRFGVRPHEWHSGVSPPRRREVWEDAIAGRARIVVGARSALFLPFRRLGLIVVDEEHDGGYKQEDGFIYQARDFAVARAKIEDCPVVLASATPSLETLWNARAGRYRWIRLAARHGEAVLPRLELVDLREEPPAAGGWLSPPLVQAMADTLARGEQTLLFLNRRGYAPLVLCRACGERMKAPDSDSWLVEHRYSGRLVCHLTGFSMPRPDRCPACAAPDSLVAIGPGVERVEEEARRLFPDARIAVFSSDHVRDAAAARALIASMTAGEIDILVATQSAAKGHNFPLLTLVGVVDADLGLRGGDLRAAERTFQLLTQVAGRAGRREKRGRALIQTWSPDHAVMRALASGDRDAFVAAELEERQAAGLPPFGRLAAVILASHNGDALETFARAMAAGAPDAQGVTVYGPADAPLAFIRGQRRKRFLVRAERQVDLPSYLAAWRARVKTPGAVRVTIDVDPYSFL